MKKVLSFLAIVLAVLTVYFCFFDNDNSRVDNKELLLQSIEENISHYPVYNRLSNEERNAYIQICSTLKEFGKSTSMIYEGKTLDEAKEFGRKIQSLYREIVYEQSEIFWADPYNSEMVINEIDGKFKVFIEPSYVLEKEDALVKKGKFDKTIDTIVTNANAKPTAFEKILYVHDYILSNCYYDDEIINSSDYNTTAINAYGCLIDGKTICSGYTLAFDAIMKRLGFECGVEFNNYSNFSILTGHVWNYCKIDDDYYYFDLTWDDTGFNSEYYKQYFDYSYSYFGITKEELSKTNFTLSSDAPTPYCGGTKYNYFVYNGYNFSEYNFEKAKEAILKQASQNYAVLRFDDYGTLLEAERDLLKDGKINSILPNKSDVRYIISNSSLYLYIFFKN